MSKPKLQAEPAYENAHLVARNSPDGEIRIDWSHVGTLAEVNRRLVAVVALLEGADE